MAEISFSSLTFLDRISEYPLIEFSIQSVKGVAAKSPVLKTEYFASTLETAKGLSLNVRTRAVTYTRPYQPKIATALERLDGYVHKQLDSLEEKHPKTFEATPEDVKKVLQERQKTVISLVNSVLEKARDKEFRSSKLAQFDEKLAPLVTYAETKIGNRVPKSQSKDDSTYHYQRALNLSKGVTGNFVSQGTEQLRALRERSPLAERAFETAESLKAVATHQVEKLDAASKFASASAKFFTGFELFKKKALELGENLKERAKAAPVPPRARKVFDDVTLFTETNLAPLYKEVLETAKADRPLSAKALRIRDLLRESAGPTLEKAAEKVKLGSAEALTRGKAAALVLKDGPARA